MLGDSLLDSSYGSFDVSNDGPPEGELPEDSLEEDGCGSEPWILLRPS